VCFVLVLNRQYQMSLLLGNETSLGHEGWSWHLAVAQRDHDAIRQRGKDEGASRNVT
jgi:hypothetical protein